MPQTLRILLGLLLGLGAGIGWTYLDYAPNALGPRLAEFAGGVWLDALRMTIIPLVVGLLITGIAQTVESVRGGRIALVSVSLFIALLWLSTAAAALLIPILLDAFPLPAAAGEALHRALPDAPATTSAAPELLDFLRSVVPPNPIAAAAGDAMMPLILFTTVFAIAATRLAAAQRRAIVDFFDAVSQTMLVIVGWVLAVAPLGVFALAFLLGIHAGGTAIGALLHYILIVSAAGLIPWVLSYGLALVAGLSPWRFAGAILPSQVVALSTQSSLACLPSMLKASRALGIADATASVSLPIAVAIFRVTSPAMNLAVVIYVAHWLGIELNPTAMAAGAAVAAITTVGSVSLPGQVSFLTSITPIAVTMGVPIEPLAVLIAIEMIPDLVRTVGNVTMDVAATSAIDRISDYAPTAKPSIKASGSVAGDDATTR